MRRKIIALLSSIGLGGVATFVLAPAKSHKQQYDVRRPSQFPLLVWRQVIIESFNDIGTKNLNVLAAGVAYFALLSFFPAMVAGVALASIVIQPAQLQNVTNDLNAYLPPDVAGVISSQLTASSGKVGGSVVVVIIAFGLALFSASGAIENLLRGLNTAYGAIENRNIVRIKLISMLFTVFAIVTVGVVAYLLAIDVGYLESIGVPWWLAMLYPVLRWVLLVCIVFVAISVLYRYAVNRATTQWFWVGWGAIIATLLWLVATAILFTLVSHVSFVRTYSLFAGIIILMMWFNFSALAVLVGAQVNARLEEKTVRKTHKQ